MDKEVEKQRKRIQDQSQQIQEQSKQIADMIYKEPEDTVEEEIDELLPGLPKAVSKFLSKL
jgi:F0F1-type ATP synthase membrane subunit b/b'